MNVRGAGRSPTTDSPAPLSIHFCTNDALQDGPVHGDGL